MPCHLLLCLSLETAAHWARAAKGQDVVEYPRAFVQENEIVLRSLVLGNQAPVPKEPAEGKGRGRGLVASWESRSAGFPPGSSRLKRHG